MKLLPGKPHVERQATMRALSPWHLVPLLYALGCSEPTGAAGDTSVGTYLLESVDGCAPGLEAQQCVPRPSWVIEGRMVLASDGHVTRTVSYRLPGDTEPTTIIATGTYSRKGDLVIFALREDAGAASYVWRPSAVLSDTGLTLWYPHPADGEIVEVFGRR